MLYIRLCFALLAAALALSGCSSEPRFVVKDEPWRADEERACLASGMVRENHFITARLGLGGPSVCGALRPFTVAATANGWVHLQPAALLRSFAASRSGLVTSATSTSWAPTNAYTVGRIARSTSPAHRRLPPNPVPTIGNASSGRSRFGRVRGAAAADIPIIGVNQGSLGFLTTFSADEARAQFGTLLRGRFNIDRRAMLDCSTGTGAHDLALNDVLLKAEENSRLVRLEVFAVNFLLAVKAVVPPNRTQ